MYTLRLDTNDSTLRLKTGAGEKIYRPSFEPAIDLYTKLREMAQSDPGSVIEELESNAELVLPDPGVSIQGEPEGGGAPDDDLDPDFTESSSSLKENDNSSYGQDFEQWKNDLGPNMEITQVDANGVSIYTARDSAGNITGTYTSDPNGNGGFGVQMTNEAVDPDDDIWDTYGDAQNFSTEGGDEEVDAIVKEALSLIPEEFR